MPAAPQLWGLPPRQDGLRGGGGRRPGGVAGDLAVAAVNRLTVAGAAYGILLAAAPGLVVRAYGGQPVRADRAVARVLGWRR